MRFLFDAEKLKKNPNVLKVDKWKLVLKTDFRIRLFRLWKDGQLEEIEKILLENGFSADKVGSDYGSTLIQSFKNSGYPLYKNEELTFSPDRINDHPLLVSGKFQLMEHRCTLQIMPTFEKELFSMFPEVSVEEGLKLAGLDLLDVGYQRINRLKRDFESRGRKRFYSPDSEDNCDPGICGIINTPGPGEEEPGQMDLLRHPYVLDYDGNTVTLTDAFYNETYLLSGISVERLLDVYELPAGYFNTRAKLIIGAKLSHWQKTDGMADSTNKQVLRIWHGRTGLLAECVASNFAGLHDLVQGTGIPGRRRVAEWIDGLPRDPWGCYTVRHVLELAGLPKSTYYELLHNENYGKGAERRARRDDEDIELVRKVAGYKGYKKGYRQICMMMEDVTGRAMSAHRVLYLMRKYGMRTNIRKPSKNRKAMKELMERNGKPNLLMRKFKLHRPNTVRLTDVTYLDYGDGLRAYGSASIDPVTGRLICFVASENNDLQLALDTLEAMDAYPAKSGGIIHSDQGILYFTDDFQAAAASRNLFQSMSRRGNCWDNAPQESFFGHFKDECDYKGCKNIEELRARIDDYRLYYNHERRLWDHGRMTPVEYEAYLDGMDEETFSAYMKNQEAAYLAAKEKSAERACKKAKAQQEAIKGRLEEIKDEAGIKREI